MNNKERLFNAFQNKPVDRVPVGFWFHFLPEEDVDNAITKPQLIEKNIEGHRKFIEAFHPDFVKIMSDGLFHYPVGQPGSIKTPEDLKSIPVLDAQHPWIQYQADIVRTVTAIQEDTAYFYNIFSPAGNLQWALGDDVFYQLLQRYPEQLCEALNTIARGLVVLAQQVVLKAGADGVYFSVSNPSLERISDEAYRQYITPSELLFLKEADHISSNNILHICGYEGKRNHLETYRDYPAKAVNWAVNVEGVNLTEGKKLFGGRAVIGGFANTSNSLIYNGSQDEIAQFTKKLINEAGRTGVIIGADCTIPRDISLEHLEWVRAAAAE